MVLRPTCHSVSVSMYVFAGCTPRGVSAHRVCSSTSLAVHVARRGIATLCESNRRSRTVRGRAATTPGEARRSDRADARQQLLTEMFPRRPVGAAPAELSMPLPVAVSATSTATLRSRRQVKNWEGPRTRLARICVLNVCIDNYEQKCVEL